MTGLWLWRLRTLRRRLSLGIRRGEVVLDVGSGHRPHPRADVLCDRFLADDSERGGHLVTDRPLVAGDLTALPFRDQAVDFVICRHVLEHVEDPAAALEELMRVGKRGYIETPSPLWEKLAGRPYHRWMIERRGARLVCHPRPASVPYRDLLPAFESFAREGCGWPLLTLEHFDDFYTTLIWDGRIEYEVRLENGAARANGKPAADPRPDGVSEVVSDVRWMEGFKSAFMGLLRVLLGSGRAVDLDGLIACPRCRGPLVHDPAWLSCGSCAKRYPIREGVPILLESEGYPLEGARPGAPSRSTRMAEGVAL